MEVSMRVAGRKQRQIPLLLISFLIFAIACVMFFMAVDFLNEGITKNIEQHPSEPYNY
jgi:hypothetical protein